MSLACPRKAVGMAPETGVFGNLTFLNLTFHHSADAAISRSLPGGFSLTRCALIAALACALLCANNALAQGKLRSIQFALHPPPTITLPVLPSQNDGTWLGLDPNYKAPAEASLG